MATVTHIIPHWTEGWLARSPAGPLAYKAAGPDAGSLVYRAEPAPEGWPEPGDVVLDIGDGGGPWAYVLMSRACLRMASTDTVWHTAAAEQLPGTWQWWERGRWEAYAWLGVLHPGKASSGAVGSDPGWRLTDSRQYAYRREYYEPSGSAYLLQNLPGWARARVEAGFDGSGAEYLDICFRAELVPSDPATGRPRLDFTDLGTGEVLTVPWDALEDAAGGAYTLNEMSARVVAHGTSE